MAVRERVETILKQVAEEEGIKNCETTPSLNALGGDGFLSQFYTGTIHNKDTDEDINVYIKVKPPREFDMVEPVFENELNFYSKIYPEFVRFQREKGAKEPFDKIAKFFCGSLDKHQEYLAFTNLQAENYVLFDKTQVFDDQHLKAIFNAYGKFHALTFAFKANNPEKYQELIKPVKKVFEMFNDIESLWVRMRENFQLALDYIKETGKGNVVKKMQLLIDDFDAIRYKIFKYEGQYSAWTHGDCWSNNMMFKYRENGVIDNLKLLDHQIGSDSTPIHDLSYFFYSGSSDFDKLEYYLELYYKSFSNFAKELGSDPEKLLPLEVLKTEWKKNAFFGIYMGIMVWEIKFMSKKDILDRTAAMEEDEDALEYLIEMGKKGRDHPLYKKTIGDLLIHAVEYGIDF